MVLHILIPNRTSNLESLRENYAGKFRETESPLFGGANGWLIDMPWAVGLGEIRYSMPEINLRMAEMYMARGDTNWKWLRIWVEDTNWSQSRPLIR
jgi:hypothetical protein